MATPIFEVARERVLVTMEIFDHGRDHETATMLQHHIKWFFPSEATTTPSAPYAKRESALRDVEPLPLTEMKRHRGSSGEP